MIVRLPYKEEEPLAFGCCSCNSNLRIVYNAMYKISPFSLRPTVSVARYDAVFFIEREGVYNLIAVACVAKP